MAERHVVIWEFTVDEAARAEFEQHYGPQGSWAALFHRAPGYLGTLLLRDASTPGRYLTIDRWQSLDAYSRFRAQFADDYAALDRQCERLTRAERALGTFTEAPTTT
jgi:heme-degrading monooxygenase HmoA